MEHIDRIGRWVVKMEEQYLLKEDQDMEDLIYIRWKDSMEAL